jgi:hypothetical protein
MKRMLMAVMAVAVLVAFSAPSFAEEGKKKGKDKKDAPKLVQMLNADEERTRRTRRRVVMPTPSVIRRRTRRKTRRASNPFLARLSGLRSPPSKTEGSFLGALLTVFHPDKNRQ